MQKLLRLKATAWAALVLVIIVIAVTFSMRTAWWTYTDLFFMFMTAFCNLVACYIAKLSPSAAKKMRNVTILFGILTILAFIGEYIALHIIY